MSSDAPHGDYHLNDGNGEPSYYASDRKEQEGFTSTFCDRQSPCNRNKCRNCGGQEGDFSCNEPV